MHEPRRAAPGHRRALPCLAAVLALAAAEVEAGAWPRGTGNGFVSLKYETEYDRERLLLRDFERDSRTSLFGEIGVAHRLTFGGEIARSGPDIAPITEFRGFARYTFLQTDTGHVASAEIGAGSRSNDFEYEIGYIRPGLAWGKGFESRWGSGWVEVEAAAEIYDDTEDETALKLDATLGLNLTERVATILQVRSGDYPGQEPYVQVASSLVVRLTERLRLQAEARAGVLNDTGVGGALALWVDF